MNYPKLLGVFLLVIILSGSIMFFIDRNNADANIGLALGVCIFEPGSMQPFNELRFYDKEGQYLGYHSKILRCTNVLSPSNGAEEVDLYQEFHNANVRMRARSGKLWIVTADASPGDDQRCLNRSGVVDPGGNWVVRAEDKGEQYFAYTINLDN